MYTNIIIRNKNTILGGVSLYLLITVAYYIYLPGTQGGFILDDIPNLSPIGKHEDISLWNNFWLYLLEGRSGPTGRPISLASFYLNDIAWPSHPASFIHTNILIHLLNGVLLFWLMIKLAITFQFTPVQKNILAVIATALWLLHPLHTTTVLYVIQRMTELSATFIFTGLLFYLYGRDLIQNSPKTGFTYLFGGVGLSLLLSILSKENGILLTVYILVLEYFLLRPLQATKPKNLNFWLVPVVITPLLIILSYVIYKVWTGVGYETRDFTMGERLLTETRIIFDYLRHILTPTIGDSSLFHDDFILSNSLLKPWATLPSVIGVITLLIVGITYRNKLPLLSFSILWFFSGHSLESTALPLELYYEHRNYLPMLGFFIAIGIFSAKQYQQHSKVIISTAALTISLLIFLTNQNAILWGKPIELVISWHEAHPNSIRSQEYLQFYKGEQAELKNGSKQTTFLTIKNITLACKNKTITPAKLNSALNTFKRQNIHTSTSDALKQFIVYWRGDGCDNIKPKHIEEFLSSMLRIAIKQKNRHYTQHVYFWMSRFHAYQGNLNSAMIYMEKSYRLIPDSSLLLIQVGYLSSAGLYQQALDRLNNTELLKTSYRKRLILKLKQPQFDRIREEISKQLKI